MQQTYFTCIASGHGALAIPATREQWLTQRQAQSLKNLCKRIDSCSDEEEARRLKSQLPVWTPRCAEFKGNHRRQSEALQPLNRMMLDIDEKGHTNDIVMQLEDGHIGRFETLLIEESVRHGTHVLVNIPVGMTPDEVQREFSEITGLKVDPAVKNVAGCIYQVPSDYTRFISEKIFELPLSLTPNSPERGEEPPSNFPERGESTSPLERAGERFLKAFDMCCGLAGLNPDGIDKEGTRHANLMAVLSVGLPKLMDKEQLKEVVKERMPGFATQPDCKELIDYFYTKYDAGKGYMSNALRNINAQIQDESGEVTPVSKYFGMTPPPLPKKLPRILELLLKPYDECYHPMLVLSALPALSAIAAHYRTDYFSHIIGAQLYCAVIAGSGRGKGLCTDVFNTLVEKTLQQWDDNEWQKVAENKVLRDKMANSDDRPARYIPKIRIIEITSKSSIFELQSNLGKNGMLLGKFSEADELANSVGGTGYSNLSVVLRKGWDGDRSSQYYLSESSCSTSTRMALSILVTGTVKAVLSRLLRDTENGIMQRFIPYLYNNDQRATLRPERRRPMTEGDKAELDNLIMKLYTEDLSLGDTTKMLDMPKSNKMIEAWYDEMDAAYADGEINEAEAALTSRIGAFMIKAGMPLVALCGTETKEIVELERWVGEVAYYGLVNLFSTRVQNDIIENDALIGEHVERAKPRSVKLLDRMPNVFTLKQLKEELQRDGLKTPARIFVKRYSSQGHVIAVSRGVYQKIVKSE